jgi:UDP-N-acetylmuramyl pentapeptide phosphotransferase/UDP-N-acetylglucosamine-1-phosphate transferase
MLEITLIAMSSALLVALAVAAFLVGTQRWHGRLTLDHELNGAQKFHVTPVPRIGGLAFAAGLLAAAWLMADQVDNPDRHMMALLAFAGLPAFATGLLEDLTKSVSVKMRLLATFVSAGLAIWLLDATLPRINTVGIDLLLAYVPVAMCFTCFAVSGVANAVNIIDGFNGLASGSVVIMLLGLAGLAWLTQDSMVMTLCLCGAAAMVGFMVLNFPFGKIFLGDGGAYLAGFWLAECGVLLVARNPEVSAWAVLLACIYPIWETLFSMWRKTFYRKTGMGRPDRVHFHMLVYRRLMAQRLPTGSAPWMQHAMTSLFIWSMVMSCQVMVLQLAGLEMQTLAMVVGVAAFAVLYVLIYRRLVLGCYPDDTVRDEAIQLR